MLLCAEAEALNVLLQGRAGTTTTDAERNVLKMELNRKISVAHRPRQLSTGKMTEQIKANREVKNCLNFTAR